MALVWFVVVVTSLAIVRADYFGLSLELCRSDSDCRGSRKCIRPGNAPDTVVSCTETLSAALSSSSQPCRCSLIQPCLMSTDCDIGEVCFELGDTKLLNCASCRIVVAALERGSRGSVDGFANCAAQGVTADKCRDSSMCAPPRTCMDLDSPSECEESTAKCICVADALVGCVGCEPCAPGESCFKMPKAQVCASNAMFLLRPGPPAVGGPCVDGAQAAAAPNTPSTTQLPAQTESSSSSSTEPVITTVAAGPSTDGDATTPAPNESASTSATVAATADSAPGTQAADDDSSDGQTGESTADASTADDTSTSSAPSASVDTSNTTVPPAQTESDSSASAEPDMTTVATVPTIDGDDATPAPHQSTSTSATVAATPDVTPGTQAADDASAGGPTGGSAGDASTSGAPSGSADPTASADPSATPAPSPSASPGGTTTAPCVSAAHLRDYGAARLVFRRHRVADVLCDAAGSCATAGHIVVFGSAAMRMARYCGLRDVACTAVAQMEVNSPRMGRGVRVASRTDGLEFTALSARHGSAAEEAVMRVVVALGW